MKQAIIDTTLLLTLFLGHAAMGADTTGTVVGTVADPSHAAIPGVEVRLVNENTNIVTVQQSNPEGGFLFNLVLPGRYTIAASAEGFRKSAVSGIVVEVNKNTRVDLTLDLGELSQTVEVTASAGRIDSVSAQVSTNVARTYVSELPTSTRSVLSFAELAPGVQLQNTSILPYLIGVVGTSALVNGNRTGGNVFYLDGSDNSGAFQNTAFQFPNPESVEEVGISTANTSAEFGKQPGGNFSVVTKSGTNDFHGSVFYYFHNSALNANGWARNRSGSARPDDTFKQTGATVGGPIRRNRTFFFGSFQRYTEDVPGFQNTVRFPTAATLAGDFSQFGRQLYNPDTGQPFPGNIIPKSLLDPVAAKLAKEIPTVPNFGDTNVWAYTDPARNNQLLAKLDHILTPKQNVQATYFHTWGGITLPQTGSNGNVPSWGPQVNKVYQDTISAHHTWVLSPRLLLENRFALARHIADRRLPNQGRDLSAFGAIWPVSEEGANINLPSLTISDGFYASQGTISYFRENNFHFASTLSYTSARHNLRFGGEFKQDIFQMTKDQDSANFNFDGRASSRGAGIGVFGYSLADFLMGRVASFKVNGVLDYDLRYNSKYAFVQDDWKILPRLTLTPGLRYELIAPSTEHNDRASAFIPGHQSNLYPNAPPGLAFLGDAGVPRGFVNPDTNNFAPRLGLAYDVRGNGKTAIRAGAGYYYSANHFRVFMPAGEGLPWVPTASGGDTTSLVDPWGTSRSIVYTHPPTPFSKDPAQYVYPPRLVNVSSYDRNFPTPYTLQWNVTAAQEIASGFTVEAGYVANRGFKLIQAVPANLPVWTANASLGNIESRRPNPTYSQINQLEARSRSWYDSFQLSANTRFSRRFTARFTYVLASAWDNAVEDLWPGNGLGKTANPLNLDGEKGPSGARNTFRAFYVYELPALKNSSSALRAVAGGWQLSGNVSAQSGIPIDVTLGQDWNYDGVAGDRPDLAGPIRYASGSKDARAARFFDPAAFAAPAIHNTFGNLRRNALYGPGWWNADVALVKSWHVTETKAVQLRGEAYDALNHNNLDNPVTTVSSKDFAKILTRSGIRTLQVALKFNY
jgi:hypothetical protein